MVILSKTAIKKHIFHFVMTSFVNGKAAKLPWWDKIIYFIWQNVKNHIQNNQKKQTPFRVYSKTSEKKSNTKYKFMCHGSIADYRHSALFFFIF